MDEDTLPKDFDKFEEEIWKMAPEKRMELLERLPENDQIRLLKANRLNELGRYEEAIECLDEIIKSFNDKEFVDGRVNDAWKRKARLFRDSGRYEEHKKCCEEMKKLFPTAEQKSY